jgi:hypothetical protein
MPETRWNTAWAVRPPEEARNFNPAFCAELIARTVGEFHKARQKPLSIATAYLVLPLVLHKPTRDALPSRANAALGTWIAENNPMLAEFPRRANRVQSVSREALLFAIRHQVLKIQGGGLAPGDKPIRLSSRPTPSTDDVDEARAAAMLLGRWFAGQVTESAILQGLGVTP